MGRPLERTWSRMAQSATAPRAQAMPALEPQMPSFRRGPGDRGALRRLRALPAWRHRPPGLATVARQWTDGKLTTDPKFVNATPDPPLAREIVSTPSARYCNAAAFERRGDPGGAATVGTPHGSETRRGNMRFIGVRSHRSANRRVGFVVATGVAVVAMLGLAGVGVAASGPVLSKSGPAQRGALPLRVPGIGRHQGRHRHHAVRHRRARPAPRSSRAHTSRRASRSSPGTTAAPTYNGVTSYDHHPRPDRVPATGQRAGAGGRGRGGRRRAPAGDQPGRADVFLNYFNKVLRALRPPRRDQARSPPPAPTLTSCSTRARPRPARTPPPSPRGSRLRRDRHPLRHCRAAVPTRSPTARHSNIWSSSRATPITARTSSRARTPTSGRRCHPAPTSRPRWPRSSARSWPARRPSTPAMPPEDTRPASSARSSRTSTPTSAATATVDAPK